MNIFMVNEIRRLGKGWRKNDFLRWKRRRQRFIIKLASNLIVNKEELKYIHGPMRFAMVNTHMHWAGPDDGSFWMSLLESS